MKQIAHDRQVVASVHREPLLLFQFCEDFFRTHTYVYRIGIIVIVCINIILDTSTCYALIFKNFFINLSTFSFFNAIRTIK